MAKNIKIEKKIKKNLQHMTDTQPDKDLYEKIRSNLNLDETSNRFLLQKTYKKWIPILATSFCLVIDFIIVVIALNTKFNLSYAAIVQVDVNPSIQMVINEDKEVLSINGLNDEGKMIVYEEGLVGKTLDEALEQIIKIEIELGYLVKTDQDVEELNDNVITITISANTEEITTQIENFSQICLDKVLKETGIEAAVQMVKGYTKEELSNLAKKLDPTLTEEEINSFTYDDYVKVVQLYHLEVVDFASVKLEQMYNDFKNYQISFTEKDAIKDMVNQLDNLYQIILVKPYNLAYDALTNAYNKMQESYYNYFIDPESDYQKACEKLATLKQAYLDQRVAITNLSNDTTDEQFEKELRKFIELKNEYNSQLVVLEGIEQASSTIYETLVEVFENTLAGLDELESKYLPDSIKEITFATLVDTETKLNQFKSEICEKFEEKYQVAIMEARKTLEERKQGLKDSLHK